MMNEQLLKQIEPTVWAIVSDKAMLLAIKSVAAEEIRLAEIEISHHVRTGDQIKAQIAVGKSDGIMSFLDGLLRVSAGYEKRKTSAINQS